MSISDLHICKTSLKSFSENESSSCECPPEYYCAHICGEDGPCTLSTLISWQHFPRSTSSRSRCDDSSEEVQRSLSETIIPSEKEEEKPSTILSSTEYPISKSIAQLQALHYLKIRHVFEFLNFLIGHLVCNEPENPVEFLVDLLGKCLRFRDSFGEAPLLFTSAHVKSLYSAFDPSGRGYITMKQYNEAMNSLNLTNSIVPFNKNPTNQEGFVEQKYFLFEAERCLVENLKEMVRIPKLWEENRLVWKKKMERRIKKQVMKENIIQREDEFEGNEKNGKKICSCSGAQVVQNLICKCQKSFSSTSTSTVCQELEQLYL